MNARQKKQNRICLALFVAAMAIPPYLAAQQASMDMDSTPGMSMAPPPNAAHAADHSSSMQPALMQGMDMDDNAAQSMLLVDELEAFHGNNANGQTWQAEGWYGTDSDKLWLRSEGERTRGRLDDADIEALWSRPISAFWDTQLGVRHDFGNGASRDWAAFGIQGLAPYWFELEATVYVGPSGRTAARFRADYELLLTQRWILQPELELNAYGKADPSRRIDSGVSDAQFGLRLRYEFTRQFAPYLGVNWSRRFGDGYGEPRFDRQLVAGVRFWF